MVKVQRLILQLDPKDDELKKALNDSFGDNVEYIEVHSFEGLSDMLQAVVPLIPPLAEFLFTYFGKPRVNNESKRVIIKKNGAKITIEGYSVEEIKDILKLT